MHTWFVLAAYMVGALGSFAADLVDTPSACQKLDLKRELTIYKDPDLFIGNLAVILSEPSLGRKLLLEESPLLTTLKGQVQMAFFPEREFKNFGAISELYELANPKLRSPKRGSGKSATRILPVQLCGLGYEALGFVVVDDFNEALKVPAKAGEGLPPSIYPNPIPDLKK